MESELSPDKGKSLPPVPIKTYQWEDLRRAREAGGYPWTYLLKHPLQGVITAEDIIRDTTPRRSMSREFSKSRTHSPVDRDVQRILNLDSSPGSSRKHGEEGEDEGVHIPNFSKEVSLDENDSNIQDIFTSKVKRPESRSSNVLIAPIEIPKNVSPKGILKRRVPEPQYIGVTETREKTKCCHPLVNKIKHLADKTLNKLDKNENEKSPLPKRKKNEESQEIRQLRSSPGAVRRQKFSAIKLGDSDEMSKTMSIDTPLQKKKKEHIYEDIEESKVLESENTISFSPDIHKFTKSEDENIVNNKKENENMIENKSVNSQDPSLVADDTASLKQQEHIMEKLHKKDDTNREAILLDDEMDPDEPNVDEIFQNQFEERTPINDSPNITITEIIDDDSECMGEQTSTIPVESSPSPSPGTEDKIKEVEFIREWSKPSRVMSTLRRWTSEGGAPLEKPVRPTREGSIQLYTPDVRCACQFFQCDSLLPERVNPIGTRPTSRASNFISNLSDHEYEIIEKPPPNIVYNIASEINNNPTIFKTDDELSSTTSLERKYLQHTSDEDDQTEDKFNIQESKHDGFANAEALQKDIEDRYFVNTPSTVSRTECEVSTSQVDSSALENLPLKRGSRSKNAESIDSKIQQRIKEGTGKLKTQAGKLKTKLQTIKTKQFMPEKAKINLPERSKFKFPERPKFTLPDRRKFSLPDRPKFKKINISEKLSLGDRKKFSFPDRPKFSVPDMPKFKMPERPKINFPSLNRKKEYKVETDVTGSSDDLKEVATVEFEAKTYPRLFGRKKKSEVPKTSSSPTLNREDTPPPTFTFTRVKKLNKESTSYIPDSPQQPREYGNINNEADFEDEERQTKDFETTYDFDKLPSEYIDNEIEPSNLNEDRNSSSIPNVSPSNQEYTHVINEIDNDEFFVRPRGISRENIQVREYLSDEIRQAFKIPKNVLALMGSEPKVNDETLYANEPEADPDLMNDDNEPVRYSSEDLNDRDDGYYTFPPVRPSRAKRKKKEPESIKYIDDSVNASMQFSDVDLSLSDQFHDHKINGNQLEENSEVVGRLDEQFDFVSKNDLKSIHEYANDEVIQYPDNLPIHSQTLPMPPKRKKKFSKKDFRHSSFNDFKNMPSAELWEEPQEESEDIIVYRTEHEYIVPQTETTITEQSPVPPRRNRSRSSRGTSLCDDDRTSHGAESLTLDTNMPPSEDINIDREIRHESPGYATVDKGPYAPSKGVRRSKSKTPPARRRKSNSSERKYYTVGSVKASMPDRPPRKKSSTSLMTLDSFSKRSISGDITQYDEIDEPQCEEIQKDLKSGEIVSKMKDRPLPPPPRPPRGPRRKKRDADNALEQSTFSSESEFSPALLQDDSKTNDIQEIEVSTQTDPLPDDVDFEIGMDENLSMSSSLRDIIDDDSMICKSLGKHTESPRISRPTSRSEKSLKFSDPKISELSKLNIGRTSPTVILVEKRVSSPTRINEREEMLTEASLTVQHIDVDETQIPDVPPLPRSRGVASTQQSPKNITAPSEERALERISDTSRSIQLDNLVTQRLQVGDLDVDRLNVSELQASKILVSDIEGMTLQVAELDSKSGHISVSGIEFSQSVIDEIVKKFAEITTSTTQTHQIPEHPRPVSREEHTQTDLVPSEEKSEPKPSPVKEDQTQLPPLPPPLPPPPGLVTVDDTATPPQRPPPPDLTPLLYSYLQDINLPPTSLYHPRSFRERLPYNDFPDSQHQSPPPPTRRNKRKPAAHHTESSSDEGLPRPSPRRMPPPVRAHEPSVVEAGAQFFRVCQNSISRTLRNIFNSFMSYINGTEDKKDVQMALVIFLVLIAGLIMFGLSDSRAIHHHHWEFFNPPDGKQ